MKRILQMLFLIGPFVLFSCENDEEGKSITPPVDKNLMVGTWVLHEHKMEFFDREWVKLKELVYIGRSMPYDIWEIELEDSINMSDSWYIYPDETWHYKLTGEDGKQFLKIVYSPDFTKSYEILSVNNKSLVVKNIDENSGHAYPDDGGQKIAHSMITTLTFNKL
ncbi:hypothetical protein [Sabulibacter ruber]|uniref:hypothetical protein n=1 Tax=Sabulibacter ruber TaxID=2811901 RepID=UPI001A97093F|nr:hypothetical protein [Sabulibacter ruber]